MSLLTEALDKIENYVEYLCQITNSESSGLDPGLSQAQIEKIIEKKLNFTMNFGDFLQRKYFHKRFMNFINGITANVLESRLLVLTIVIGV